jgi:hypothetical protein
MSVDVSINATTEELADTLLLLGKAQSLMDGISPKAMARLAELGMIRRSPDKPPQLTTLGEVFFWRLTAGERIPNLDHLA